MYPIKHKLKEYAVMKNFMTSGVLAKGKKPEGDLGRKDATPFPGEELGTQTGTRQARQDPLMSQILALLGIGTMVSGTQRYRGPRFLIHTHTHTHTYIPKGRNDKRDGLGPWTRRSIND
jgi:hypothetical protein